MVAANERPPRRGSVRLAKFLAHAGVASRRGAEAVIAAGRVGCGGSVVTDPALDVGEADEVAVDGAANRAGPSRASCMPWTSPWESSPRPATHMGAGRSSSSSPAKGLRCIRSDASIGDGAA